jgi:dolichol kinase
MSRMDKETKRKTIHISMGFLTLLIAFFPRWLSILCVLIALFFILVIARPSMWKRSFDAMASREEDVESGLLYGPLLYILMVLLAVIIYDLRVAAVVFAVMAFGDGFANVIGSRFGKHRYARFNNKSLEGFFAFIIFAFISSSVVFFLVSFNNDLTSWIEFLNIKSPEDLRFPYVVAVLLINSIITATIEISANNRINDNIAVPLVTGILLTILLKL